MLRNEIAVASILDTAYVWVTMHAGQERPQCPLGLSPATLTPTLEKNCGMWHPLGPAPSIREPVPLTAHAQPVTGARGFHFLGHWVVGSTFVHPLVLLAGVHNLEVS